MAERIRNFDFLTPDNIKILKKSRLFDINDLRPVLLQCRTRVLMVADGTLDFSPTRDFGMGTFADILLDMMVPAKVDLTLAHMRSTGNLLTGDTRVVNRIHQFKFDDPSHFGTNMYDAVFLFGIDTSFRDRPNGYNGSQLTNAELNALTEYMNGDGGLFCTGDHAALGRAMSHMIPRAGKMRLWDSTSSNDDDDEVSMTGPRRNDTNRLGDPGSQFDDQSDDIPQDIHPRMYTKNTAIFKYTFPHPLLCGPNGPIRVMPDHPHEGECVEPTSVNGDIDFGVNHGPEFPPATDGGPRPLPEVISTNTVPGGNISTSSFFGDKDPTIPHSFGGICAYDGHRAGVGRVVTDATWHHFVNINLVGDSSITNGSVKDFGFLASPQGQQHFEDIKSYYRNLVVWLSRPSVIRCMNRGWVFELVRNARVVEAITTATAVRLEQTSVRTLLLIGEHAKDVLGKFAGQCQTRRLQCWIACRLPQAPEFDVLARDFDPWAPRDPRERVKKTDKNLGFSNLSPIFDIAFGAALVEANRFFEENGEKFDAEKLDAVMAEGAQRGIKIAGKALTAGQKQIAAAAAAFK